LDGQRLAVTLTKFRGTQNWKNTLQVWQVGTGGKSELEIGDASEAKFSPDGHWLAYSDETAERSMSHPFLGEVPGLPYLPRAVVIPAGVETGRNSSMLQTT
jgi:dipeptidyl aminopeptidase/acylaminoacyl peptidase